MSSKQRNLRKLVCKEIIYITLIVTLLPLSFSADAQQIGKVHRIGVLDEGTPGERTSREIRPFRNGLRGLGYVDGKNIVLEYRNADGKIERLPGLMAELLHLGPDVIIATSGAFSMAARQATSVVPIVMTVSGDPVASDLAASLARPGGNVTGLTIVPRELSGKRLEVLKEAIPGISRITVLWSQAAVKEPADLRETKRVARTLRLHVHSLRLEAAGELENAFERPAAVGAQALIPLSHRFIAIHRNRLIALATKGRLPAMYANRHFVEAGGLMSYGPNHSDLVRRAACFVDKILKGAKPGDLPIEQATKVEFVINLKAAKQIGLTIPPEVLMWADEVIQ